MRAPAILAAPFFWAAARAAPSTVPIATFDGAAGTSLSWEPVDDPVMGGQSHSEFSVDSSRHVGMWNGQVKIVPFLQSPGFCNLQSPGLYKRTDFPDLSGTDGLVARMRESLDSGLKRFNVMLMSRGARRGQQEGVYTASFEVGMTMDDHFVPWSAFKCSWRGQKVDWCPPLTTQLKEISAVGFGTYYPGTPGFFMVEIESLSAGPKPVDFVPPVTGPSTDALVLAAFDGSTKHTWHVEDDPVMGGVSFSKFTVMDGYGDYQGSVRIVPSLQAPGFTFALTESPLMARFPDVSGMDGLLLGVRVVGGNVTTFKAAFCDVRINVYRCQFQSFKADFSVEPSADFQDVFVPWSAFSDKWSASTGEHTAESPPQTKNLKSITQLQIWVEGVAGDFHIQIKHILAAKPPVAVHI